MASLGIRGESRTCRDGLEPASAHPWDSPAAPRPACTNQPASQQLVRLMSARLDLSSAR